MRQATRQARPPLFRFFNPESIAVIGASANPQKLGHALLRNIVEGGYRGRLYPVNPNADTILGLPCVADASALPEGIDLAIVILPAPKVPAVLRVLAARGVAGAVVPAGGFAELGGEGVAWQREIERIASQTGIRVLGPNVPGFINADAGLNATFAGGPAGGGPLAVVSQAGSVAYLLVRNFLAERIRFGRFICVGNQADVSDAEVLEYLAEDPGVGAIAMYIESVKDGPRFLEAAAGTAPSKPIVAVKGGRSAVGHGAIFSHTASVSSPHRIYRAAFRRAGVVWADSLRTLGTLAFALAHQRQVGGDRVAIVTSLAGVGVVAADACEQAGLAVPGPSPALAQALREIVPPSGSVRNPIDLTGDVNPAMLARATAALVEGDEYDCVVPLVMGVPGSATFGNAAYVAALGPVVEGAVKAGKGVSVGWVMDEADGAEIAQVRAALHAVGVPVSPFPEDAVAVVRGLVEYGRYRCHRQSPRGDRRARPVAWERGVRAKASAGAEVLTEHECKQLLEAAGLAVVPSRLAGDADAAAAHAARLGYPAVLKLQSPDATHKSSLGGVALDLGDEAAVRAAFEAIAAGFRQACPDGRLDGVSVQPMVRRQGLELVCGVAQDPQFGKYVVVGLGGVAVEILEDVSLRLLPVDEADAEEMLRELRSYPLLDGYRAMPAVDRRALVRFVADLCRLAEMDEIVELEVNPLLATERGAWAMDARLRLRTGGGV
jgi:acetyltransferase